MKPWDKATVDTQLTSLNFPGVGEHASSFSWVPCFTCKRPEGGERYKLNYIDEGELWFEEICLDCLIYIANGEVPLD